MFVPIMRGQIEAAPDLDTAKAICRHSVRFAVRRHLYHYARRHYIVDFDDLVLVEDRHRTHRANVIAQAQTLATNIDTSASIDDVLAVFDTIADYLE